MWVFVVVILFKKYMLIRQYSWGIQQSDGICIFMYSIVEDWGSNSRYAFIHTGHCPSAAATIIKATTHTKNMMTMTTTRRTLFIIDADFWFRIEFSTLRRNGLWSSAEKNVFCCEIERLVLNNRKLGLPLYSCVIPHKQNTHTHTIERKIYISCFLLH